MQLLRRFFPLLPPIAASGQFAVNKYRLLEASDCSIAPAILGHDKDMHARITPSKCLSLFGYHVRTFRLHLLPNFLLLTQAASCLPFLGYLLIVEQIISSFRAVSRKADATISLPIVEATDTPTSLFHPNSSEASM
jgi:hypothetical protein